MSPGGLKEWIKEKTPPSVWGFVRVALYGLRDRSYRKRTVSHTYGGKQLHVYLANPIAVAWYDHDYLPLPEIERLKTHGLKPGARVFDLGAHQCVVAMMLAEAVGSEGKVVAVEASSFDAAVGVRNRTLNGYANIEILSAAVGEASGKLAFTSGGHVNQGTKDSDGRIWVDCFSVDDLAARYGSPDVLFLDIEGYEVRALRGATETLKKSPDCFVEVHVGAGLEAFGESVESVLNFFPPDKFELLIRNDEDDDFAAYQPDDPRLKSRFFLLALARR